MPKCSECSGSGDRPLAGHHEFEKCGACNGTGERPDLNVDEINKLREQNDLLSKQVESLAAFKTFVHDFLDKKGIDRDPPGEHRDAGCRIGQRLELVFDRWTGDRVEFNDFKHAIAMLLEWEAAVKAYGKGTDVDASGLKTRVAGFMRDYARLGKAADATHKENVALREEREAFREVVTEFLRMVPTCTREWVMFDGVMTCTEAQKRAAEDYTMRPDIQKCINGRMCLRCRVKKLSGF